MTQNSLSTDVKEKISTNIKDCEKCKFIMGRLGEISRLRPLLKYTVIGMWRIVMVTTWIIWNFLSTNALDMISEKANWS